MDRDRVIQKVQGDKGGGDLRRLDSLDAAGYQFVMGLQRTRLPAISLEQTLTLSVVGLTTIFSITKPVSTIDLDIFLRMGAWMAEEGRLLEVEPFALSALGTRFQNGTWLSQLVLHYWFSARGYPGLQILLGLAVLSTFVVTTSHVVSRGGWKVTVLGVLFAAAFMIQNLAIRPQTFSMMLFALAYYLLDVHPQRRATPVALFFVMALWANLHGAFPIAFVIPVVKGLQSVLRPRAGVSVAPGRWLLLGGTMMVATFVNPYGPGLYRYIFENSMLPVARGFSEWLPPAPATFLGGRFYLSFLVVGAVIVWRRKTVRIDEIVLLTIFAIMASRSQRMIVWWGLIGAPILVRWLSSGESRGVPAVSGPPQRLHTAFGWGMIVFWVALAGAVFPGSRADLAGNEGENSVLDDDTPVEAVNFLKARRAGRLFHRLEWGGYLARRLWPAQQPFIDIRAWVFSDSIWDRYLSASRGERGWEALLAGFRIDTLVLSRETQALLIDAVRADGHWQQVYEDRLSVIFERGIADGGGAL